MRWELNDLARRLDERSIALVANEDLVPAPESSGSLPNVNALRILETIEAMSDEQREAFNLIRIQGMTQNEAAEILGVSPKTIQRRLAAGLLFLTRQLGDLQPQPLE
jgi:RNA polymerase sigma-70 factor (ECF subfamily)